MNIEVLCSHSYDNIQIVYPEDMNKSDTFPLGFALCFGCPLLLVQFVTFTDRISSHSHRVENFRFNGLEIASAVCR